MTIDKLFLKLDSVKLQYNRQNLLRYLFDFSYELVDHMKLPHTQKAYDTVIQWKMRSMYDYCEKKYWCEKNFVGTYIDVNAKCHIPKDIVLVEARNFKKYLADIGGRSALE